MANGDKKKEIILDKDLVATPDSRVPKYCTGVLVSKRSDGNIILTFLYSDSQEEKEAVVINRVIIDGDHAGKLANAIKDAVETDTKKKV